MNQGVDYYFGIPFSNDMSKTEQEIVGNSKYPYQLPLMEGYDTLELDPDQHLFTKRLTEKARPAGKVTNQTKQQHYIQCF